MEELHLSHTWYVVKINYYLKILEDIPNIKLGKHSGHEVLWAHENNERKEIRKGTSKYNELLTQAMLRTSIERELTLLKREYHKYYREPLGLSRKRFTVIPNTTSPMTYNNWKSLIDQECPLEKKYEYKVGPHIFRSRIEMQTAQAARELHLTYKYDCGINISYGHKDYLDFAFVFPEFNRWVAYEVFGMLDDPGYIARSGEKIRKYMQQGLFPERDFFMQSGSSNYMENTDMVKKHLIYIVDKLCDIYVQEIN